MAKPLKELAADVKTEVHNAKFIPRLTDVRRDIERLKRDGKRFEASLNRVSKRLLDLPLQALALVDGEEGKALGNARRAIDDINAFIAECEQRGIRSKPGRRRPPGKVTCALIVIEAWASVRSKAPSANNEDAQEACETYWQACGGQPAANWPRTLNAARAVRSKWRQYIRDEIRRGAE